MNQNRVVSLVDAQKYLKATLALGLLGLFGVGCGSGLDPTAIGIEGRVIDYKKQVTPAVAEIFGKLLPNEGMVFTEDLPNQYQAAKKELSEIEQLSSTYSFDKAQKTALRNWAERVKEILAPLGKNLAPKAFESIDGLTAKNMADALALLLSEKSIDALLENPEIIKSLPKSARASFKVKYLSFKGFVERLFQNLVLLANAHEQRMANDQLNAIRKGIDSLEGKLQDGQRILNDKDRKKALKTLGDARKQLDSIRAIVLDMTRPSDFIGEKLLKAFKRLSGHIVAINKNLVAKTKNHVKKLVNDIYDPIMADLVKLKTVLVRYNDIIEDLNYPEEDDSKLLQLIGDAFEGKISRPVELKLKEIDTTDIIDLARLLSREKKVLLRADESSQNIVYALAQAISSNVAQAYGLVITDIIVPDHDRINKDRAELVMNDAEFDQYLKSIGNKISKMKLKDESEKRLYIIFASSFPQGSDVGSIVAELEKDDGAKLLIIDFDTLKWGGKLFSPRGLSLSEGLILTDRLLKHEGINNDSFLISDRIVRLFAAFGSMKLGNIGPLVERVAARLRLHVNSSDEVIKEEVINSFRAMGLKVNPVDRVFKDSLAEIEKNVGDDPDHYRK